MNEVSVISLGAILPEIILLIGGILVMLLDMTLGDQEQKETGRGFMAITVLFLLVGLVGVFLQMGFNTPVNPLPTINVDPFAAFLKIVIYTSMVLVAVAGGGYMNKHIAWHGEFWSLFIFVTIAMSLAVSADNLVLLFLAIEFLSITSYILVGFFREDDRSSEAGVKYFLYGSVSSSVMLYGMSLLYGATGAVNLTEIGQAFNENPDLGVVVLPATLMTLVGLGFKASLAPFFQWAPDAYDGAPTPVTAYLSTASKAVGFAVMARLLLVSFGAYATDWVPVLAGLSILTMSAGNLMALRQNNVKRMLAYSSVAQAGYILMGLVAVVSSGQADLNSLTLNGLNGVLIYIFAYLFTNIGAFMVVLAVEDSLGSTDISAYDNLGQRSPALAWAMFIFMLSLTGIPLTGGFIGKFYVFGAAVQHQYFWLAAIAMVNAGVAAFYYLNLARAMFFTSSNDEEPAAVGFPIGIGIQVCVLLCVVATIWIGLYPPNVIEWANDASRQLLTMGF